MRSKRGTRHFSDETHGREMEQRKEDGPITSLNYYYDPISENPAYGHKNKL